METSSEQIEAWLARHTRRDAATGCLVWESATHGGYAYGRFPGLGVTKVARALYQSAYGPLDTGTAVRQDCGNQACCELEHFAALPRGQAVLDGRGPGALNARKTACKRGHPFDDTNTYHDPSGRRRCRQCVRAQEQAWHAAGRRGLGRLRCEAVSA